MSDGAIAAAVRRDAHDCDYCWAHHLGGMVEGEDVVAHRCPSCGCDYPESDRARRKRLGGLTTDEIESALRDRGDERRRATRTAILNAACAGLAGMSVEDARAKWPGLLSTLDELITAFEIAVAHTGGLTDSAV